MGRKRIYKCDRCGALFSGAVALTYHVNAHRRVEPVKPKPIAPRRASVYDEGIGNDPAPLKGES